MRPFIIIFLSMFILCGCEEKKDPKDPVKDLIIQEKAQEMTDSIINSAKLSVFWDTLGVGNAPVKILSSKIVSAGEYSNRKNIKLTYKNISGKKINAIRFRWYGTNAFNEPADMGTSIQEGFGGGFTDNELNAGKTSGGEWEILSKDAKSVKLAWPYEVAFADGTIWKSSYK